MKHLLEFLKESPIANMCEANFKKGKDNDWLKHEYALNLVTNILNTKHGDDDCKVIINGHKLSELEQKDIKRIQTKITDVFGKYIKDNDNEGVIGVGVDEFDNCFDNDIKQKLGVGSSTFIKIDKSPYSGKDTASATYGQTFESLVCYLYNYGDNANIDEWVKDCNVDPNNSRYNAWIKSSRLSANLLIEKFGNNYIAYHVDAKDKLKDPDKKYLDICKIFSGKNGIKAVLTDSENPNKWDDIYQGNKKDKWNPADIVLISKDLDLDDTINKFKSCPNGEGLNNILVDYTINKMILPVSLKMINENGKLYAHNISSDEELAEDRHNISNITIKFGKNYDPDVLSGNFVIDGDSADIQIRKQAGTKNLSIEAQLQSNKSARGGKGISVIKHDLGIKSNEEYYADLKNDDEIITNFKNIGIKFTDKELKDFQNLCNKYQNDKCPLHTRICYVGFIGLAKKWKEKYHKDDNWSEEILVKFIQYLWDACTKCPGAYYIIK